MNPFKIKIGIFKIGPQFDEVMVNMHYKIYSRTYIYNLLLCIKSVNVVLIHTNCYHNIIYQIMLFLNNKLDRMNMFDFIHETHFILCYVCIMPVSSAHHPLFTSTPIVSEPLPSISLNYYFVRRL